MAVALIKRTLGSVCSKSISRTIINMLYLFIVVSALVNLSAAQAQRSPVVDDDKNLDPMCQDPAGCFNQQQFEDDLKRSPPASTILYLTPNGSPRDPTEISANAVNIGIKCAKQAGTDVSSFALCTGGQVILPKKEQAVLDCAASSQTSQRFAICAAPSLGISLSKRQRIVLSCAVSSSGDQDKFAFCAEGYIVNKQLNPTQQQILTCAASSNGDASKFVGCSGQAVFGSKLTREQRVAVQCAAESSGDYTSFATCAGTNLFNLHLNPEQQIAVSCVVETGGQPYAAAGCIATRLVARELEKCVTNGFGGVNGCFGDNNDIVGKSGWTSRTMRQIMGGKNSVVNNPVQVLGGPGSFARQTLPLFTGTNVIVTNPNQFWPAFQSIIRKPSGALPQATVGSVDGHKIKVCWSFPFC